jgi:hypothetical protein
MSLFDIFKNEYSSGKTFDKPINSRANSCSLQQAKGKPTKTNKNIPCNFSEVKYIIGGTTLSLNPNQKKAEFIAGYSSSPKNFVINLLGGEGPCPSHTLKVFDGRNSFNPKDNFSAGLELKSEEFHIFHKGDIHYLSSSKIKSYNIHSNTCSKTDSFHVNVYPDVELEFNLNISLNKSKSDTKIDIAGSYKQDGRTTKLSLLEFEKKIENLRDTVELVDNINNTISSLTGKIFKCDYIYPSLNFKGSAKFEEAEKYNGERYVVQLKNKLELGLGPLVGVNFEWDILGTITEIASNSTGAGPLIKILKYIARFAENVEEKNNNNESEKLKFEVKFTVVGTLDGNLFYESISHQKSLIEKKTGGELKGKIEAELKLDFEGTLNVLCCSIGGGINIGSKAIARGQAQIYHNEVTSSAEAMLRVDFDGMKAYVIIYIQASGLHAREVVVEDDVKDPKAPKSKTKEEAETKLGSGKHEIMNEEWDILEPNVWLEHKTFK